LYGGWGRGEVHSESDLDIAPLVLELDSFVPVSWDFKVRLAKNGMGYRVHTFGNILITDTEAVRELKAGKNLLVGTDFKVVTPYHEVMKELSV